MPWEEPISGSSSTLKRPRPSGGGVPAPAAARSHKKRKADSDDADDASSKGKQPMSFGVGMVKGREDEWGEPADVQTKIDFNELPDDTLYRYLELHDLLPRWTTSPWSEEPCTPPNALYALAPAQTAVPVVPDETEDAPPETSTTTEQPPVENGEPVEGMEDGSDDTPVAPTTRSKTAPLRKLPTPPPTAAEIKRGVITLSDVAAARAVLAEKANAHWVKGLGGGQNKEGETIVQFLYKMKVGPGRLLRVYNPYPPPFAY